MKTCSWGQCPEPATQIVRWSNADPPKRNQVTRELPSTIASYCDVHVQEATQHGAVHVGPYTQSEDS